MDFNKLTLLNYNDLKELSQEMELPPSRSKNELIRNISHAFKEYEEYKEDKVDKYTIKKQLGAKGKEGTTYLVTTKSGKEYAMKTFRKRKSSTTLKKEAKLQSKASKYNICPRVIDVDVVSKYIVMDRLDGHLLDLIDKQHRILKTSQQKQIIEIYKLLDEAKVFHGDVNLMNYMLLGKTIYLIDFGMAKPINKSLITKLGTSTPNLNIMTLGIILKLKEYDCDPSSYEYLKTYLSKEQKMQFQI